MQEPSAPRTARSRARRVLELSGLDFHVSLTLAFRAWSIVAGAVMVILVPLWLSKIEQGYYYTFGSLLALNIFFELGVNQVVSQVVGHEAAHLRAGAGGSLTGPARHLGRLASVVQLLHKWYLLAAVLFFAGVGTAGAAFLLRNGELPPGRWLPTWWMLVTASAANLYLSPRLSVLEGIGRVGNVARLRLGQSFVGYLVLWLALLGGAGLWSIAAVPAVAVVGSWIWLSRGDNPIPWLRAYRAEALADQVNWRREVLPFQWRIAVSWISGYFIFQLFTPAVFERDGAREAGRLGIALSLFSAVTTLGLGWVNAKIPAMTGALATGGGARAVEIHRAVTLRAVGFTAMTSLLLVSAVAVLQANRWGAADRIIDWPVLAFLAIGTVANTYTASAATFIRAHKEEPLLPQSITIALLTSACVWLGSRAGTLAMIGTYAVVLVLVAAPWVGMLTRRYERRAVLVESLSAVPADPK